MEDQLSLPTSGMVTGEIRLEIILLASLWLSD
jgi:hypothetical protein